MGGEMGSRKRSEKPESGLSMEQIAQRLDEVDSRSEDTFRSVRALGEDLLRMKSVVELRGDQPPSAKNSPKWVNALSENESNPDRRWIHTVFGTNGFFAELDLLAKWVDGFLVPLFVQEPRPDHPWCPNWRNHPDAVGWLHALQLSYLAVHDPDEPTGLEPITWLRDSLTPAMHYLRDPGGPFAKCMIRPSELSYQQAMPLYDCPRA
jgi:hypothetical protein